MTTVPTLNPAHLGDGVYVGLDAGGGHQIWLGANHHMNMTVALGPDELRALLDWVKLRAPHIAQETGI